MAPTSEHRILRAEVFTKSNPIRLIPPVIETGGFQAREPKRAFVLWTNIFKTHLRTLGQSRYIPKVLPQKLGDLNPKALREGTPKKEGPSKDHTVTPPVTSAIPDGIPEPP